MPWVYQEVTKVVPVSQPPMAMSRGEEKDAGPADKTKRSRLSRSSRMSKPSPLRRASYSDRHEISFMERYKASLGADS